MHSIFVHLFFSKIDRLSNAQSHDRNGVHAVFIHALQTFASQRISSTVSSYMTWNENTTETKMDISKFISFRFVSVFRIF